MKIRVVSSAEQELAEAVDYYNEQRPGLGYEFAAEIKSTLNRIVAFPDAWPLFSHRLRRCITNKFPYGILYQVRIDHILIVAIMHLKRDPQHWQDRLKKV
jgi:plasmid stabilization system protein ParE